MSERARPKQQQQFQALVVGGAILLIVALMVFVVFWAKQFALRPHYTFYARFIEPPYVNVGAPVNFRGVRVGQVSSVALTTTGDAVLVGISIHEKDLQLPVNTRVTIHTEGITGIVYLSLTFPEDEPLASRFITDGMVVQGIEPFSFDKIQRALNRLAEEGTLEELMEKLSNGLDESRAVISDIRQAAQNTAAFMARAETAAEHSNQLIADLRGTNVQLAQAFTRNEPLLTGSLQSFQQTNQRIQNLVGGVSGVFENGGPTLIPEAPLQKALGSFQEAAHSVQSAMQSFGQASQEADQTLRFVRQELQDTNTIRTLGSEATNVMNRVNLATDRFDCIQQGVASLLDKRFLLFRLTFGRPGEHLEACQDPQFLTGPQGLRAVSGCPPAPPPCSPASSPAP
jgi:ABC-type transporter Mla subunit MlaD